MFIRFIKSNIHGLVECLLNVHLICGNHGTADINALFGFRIECIERMGERDGIWAWHQINGLFNWLPLAALISVLFSFLWVATYCKNISQSWEAGCN
ncbi:serine/threonine-protein phosphatase BSL2 homolog [Apium graveolens]|uniref:serine/threonine-protein phosphatase BSL2 homolog n=1 Tax=Apium graveolens TaxID=4045 RepID=UPI003D7B501F